jgi:hypothetical protein
VSKRSIPLMLMAATAWMGCGGTSDPGGTGDAGSDPTATDAGGEPTVALIDCVERDVADARQVGGVIDADATWSGKIRISGNVTVQNGATLTIEPGTHVIADADSSLELG